MERERLLTKISELYYLENLEQIEIAKKYNFSTSKVSRLLQEAKSKQIVKFYISNQYSRNSKIERELEKKYNINESLVYYNSQGEYNEMLTFKGVAQLAAQYLESILKEGLNIAITWGKTLYWVVESLNVEKEYNLNIFSTLGGLGLTKPEYQNNYLVNMLKNKIGGYAYHVYLPLVLDDPIHKKFLANNNNIERILGDFSNVDYYIAGVGNISKNSRMQILGAFSEKEILELRKKNIVGEMGLNFYDINGNFVNTNIRDKIVNLDITDIKKINNKIIIAFGKQKVEAIRGILRSEIPDALITDSVTAESLIAN